MRVELTGVNINVASQQNISPELKAWRYEKSDMGGAINFVTATPVTPRSGWKVLLLTPGTATGGRYRLVLDLSPCLSRRYAASYRGKRYWRSCPYA